MSGPEPLTPLTLLGAGDGPACEGDACLVPGAAGQRDAGSSPAAPTDR
jgi:hypothetical protein